MNNDELKKQLRQHFLEIRKNVDSKYFQDNQLIIDRKVINCIKQSNAKSIGIYLAIEKQNEVETSKIIEYCFENNISVFVPRWNNNEMNFYKISNLKDDIELVNNRYLEPKLSNPLLKEKLDLIFIPLVAFDNYKNRLGYGAGYYDRWLINNYNLYSKKVGLGWKFQHSILPIPIDKYDQKLDSIITDDKEFN